MEERKQALSILPRQILLANQILKNPKASPALKKRIRIRLKKAIDNTAKFEGLGEEGVVRGNSLKVMAAASAIIVADDVTIAGFADDFLLIIPAIAALLILAFTSPEQLNQSWHLAKASLNSLTSIIMVGSVLIGGSISATSVEDQVKDIDSNAIGDIFPGKNKPSEVFKDIIEAMAEIELISLMPGGHDPDNKGR